MHQNGLLSPLRALGRGRRFVFVAALFPLCALRARAQLDKTDTAPVPHPAAAPVSGFVTAERTTRHLAPGVTWTQEITPANLPGGPLVVNVVRITPGAAGHDRLRTALGSATVWENNATQGRETVGRIAAGNHALIAINASFFTFSSGHPLGLDVQNGEAVTEPMLSRSALRVGAAGEADIATFTGRGLVTAADGATFPLDGLNRKPGKGSELLLFTPRFFGATLPALGRFEARVTGVKSVRFGETVAGTVDQVGGGGGTLIAPQTVVLSGSGAGAEFLRGHVAARQRVTVRYDVSPTLKGARQVVAGGPRLVEDGRIAVRDVAEGFAGAFSTGRHPRTAVGVTEDGAILLLTVDGRQPFLSRGATLAETAALLMKFGAVSGVNMDGGGSSAMAVRGAVVNSPSEGEERPVATALVLVSDEPRRMSRAVIDAEALSSGFAGEMRVGETRSFSLPAGVSRREGETAVWGAAGNVGFVTQGGRFVALRGGAGSVLVTLAGGRRFRAPVSVAKPVPIPRPAPVRGAPAPP